MVKRVITKMKLDEIIKINCFAEIKYKLRGNEIKKKKFRNDLRQKIQYIFQIQ